MVRLQLTTPMLLLMLVTFISYNTPTSAQKVKCEPCKYTDFKGSRGPTGRKGQKGSTGIPGVRGLAGIAGPKGSTGPKGDKGSTGSPGELGEPGRCFNIIGKPGSGIKGNKGVKGVRGPSGPEGDQGERGPKGMKGDCCTTLIKGTKGSRGPSGDPGRPRSKGPDGLKGYKGQQGITIGLFEQENLVQQHITELQDQIEQCCESGGNRGKRLIPELEPAEPTIGPTIRPPGPTIRPPGPTIRPPSRHFPGLKGNRGLPGSKGEKGERGLIGSPGTTGSTGGKGNRGSIGEIGSPGPRGPLGAPATIRICSPCPQNKGTKGAKGDMGDPGFAGIPGLTGPKGIKGQPGACIKGETGNVGEPGKPGIDGQIGDSGNRGPTGPPGDNKVISSPSLIHRLQTTIDIVRTKISKCCSAFRLGRDTNRITRQISPQPICDFPAVEKREILQSEKVSQPSHNSRQSRSSCIYYRGPPGEPGTPGPRGDTGSRGYTGSIGAQGAHGPTGDKGSKGHHGSPGLKGIRGRDYVQTCLPKGLPGMKGDRGERGYQGPQGKIGPRGLPGDACAPSYGPRGDVGEPGSPGKIGIKGQKGDSGPQGEKGNMALGDITEQTYEKYLQKLQEIIEKVESGTCCIQETCTYNGVVYQQGEQIKPNCTTKCACQNGQWDCSKTQCFDAATCYASGDPHYSTFDGRRYDFQGICEYVLAKDCQRGRFIVTVVNTPCGGGTVSCTTQVTVTVPNLNLVVVLKRGPAGGELHVNGAHHPYMGNGHILSNGEVEIVRSSDSLMVTLTNTGLVVIWKGTSIVYVKASSGLQNELCGLCGNFNGDQTDDFQNPNGVEEDDVNDFGFSWLHGNNSVKNCTLPPPDPCPSFIQTRGVSRCNVFKGPQFSACHSTISPEPYIADCIYDYCRCPSNEREMCYCDSLESYAKACAAKGIVLNKWRNLFCPVVCPSGMEYQECGSACPATCENHANPPVCYDICVDGCFCPPGQVLLNNTKCIEVEDCPAVSCSRMPNVQNLGPGLPLKGAFSSVMVDVGRCSGNCQGRCLPNKTKIEIVHLYSGPREVEIIDSCECLLNDGSSCATVKKEVTYFQGTSYEATVHVNQCAGSCGAEGIRCQPTKEKSVAIDAGKNGVTTATVIEECQCVSDCYKKSYYEKVTRITDKTQEEVEIDVGVCMGHCRFTGQCRPNKTSQYSGLGRLEKNGKTYKPVIIESCGCVL